MIPADSELPANRKRPASRQPSGSPATLARAARYSRWDGSQSVPDLAADEILDALSEDLLAEGDVEDALRRLIERGWRFADPTRENLTGLRDLIERIRERRSDVLDRYRLGDVLADVRAELDEIIDQERTGIRERLDRSGVTEGAGDPQLGELLRETAARRLDRLDALPDDVGGKVEALRDYDFLEPGARERFEALVDRLSRAVLDRFAAGLADAVRSMTPEDLAANREMVRDLDRLLSQRLAGEDPDPAEFLQKHGRFFPGAQTLDDIIEQLAQRMAAMQSLLASLSPEQRAELGSLMDALLRDDRLRWDLAQLAATLDRLLPGGLGDRVRFHGDEPLGLEGALAQLTTLSTLDSLEDSLANVESIADLGSVNRERLGELLGAESVRELDALQSLARRLEEAGYLQQRGDRLELTPRGSRRIGQKVLDDLFGRLRRDGFGGHQIGRTGRGGERDDTTKQYEFGDPFHLDLGRTLANALQRPENAPGRRVGPALSLAAEDLEVARTEALTRTSTVLLVDMSRSMLLRGCFVAAKKVAVALDTLIRTRYPRDGLAIVGFAYYAREIRPEALAELSWHGYEYGTNLQHALMLARRILARSGAANREVVVITDGEPTAHFEGGQVEFSYPPTRRTIEETLLEVRRCTREGITINTFMLERSRALTEFVARMTRLNRGRAFYAEPERLGEYVLVDYVANKTSRRSA